MASPLVVVVLVVAGDASAPATPAMIATAREALGGSAVVLVQEVKAPASDEQAKQVGEKVHADAVVQVTWTDGSRAHLHVRLPRDERWADRDLLFGASDAPSERGRAVGLAIATMVPPEPPPKAAPAPTPTAPAPAVTRASTIVTLDRRDIGARGPRFALDAAAIGAIGFGGSGAGGAGGELAVRYLLPDLGALRVGGGARFGEIDAARALTSTARLGAGVVVDAGHVGAVVVHVQVDALLLRHSASRRAAEGNHEVRSRFVGAADLLVDAEWPLAPKVAAFLATGVELALGETRIVVGSETVTAIPRARLLGLLGLRLRL